jgi:SNW domain-containing protein 1
VGGFTIPLDKRLAADGRGLQEQTINNNFATLSESLYIAERKAREELESRAKITAKLRAKEKDQKEEELRQMAAKARMARAGIQDSEQVATQRVR